MNHLPKKQKARIKDEKDDKIKQRVKIEEKCE